jgi:hypothetical protein
MSLKTRWPFVGMLALLLVVSASSQTITDKDKPKTQTPPPRQESRPKPSQEYRPEPRQETPREERPYPAPRQGQSGDQPTRKNNEYAPSSREYHPAGGEYHPGAPAAVYRQTAPLHEHEYGYHLGANHPGTGVVTPTDTPAFRRARVYNTRINGVHVSPEYFATNFGMNHQFHFPSAGPPYFVLYQGEWYCQVNGTTFGVMGALPAAWNVAMENLYIDIGDDGNYYLYDTNQPNIAIQLTFVQAKGDDQADYPDSGNPDQ